MKEATSTHPVKKAVRTTTGKRFVIMITALGFISVRSFAMEVGMKPTVFYNVIGGRNKPSVDTLNRIRRAFPTMNINWILTGEGPVLIPKREN